MVDAKPFIYDTSVVSERAFYEHVKLYQGYVNKLNEIDNKLKMNPQYEGANSVYSHYRALKKSETLCIDGIILHELYFSIMRTRRKKPDIDTQKIFTRFFGGYESWLKDFIACSKAGRGWCVLVYEQRTKSFRNIMQDAQDEGNIWAGYPILPIDIYEHAYFMDYGTDRAKYIENFISSIDWDIVGNRIRTLKIL